MDYDNAEKVQDRFKGRREERRRKIGIVRGDIKKEGRGNVDWYKSGLAYVGIKELFKGEVNRTRMTVTGKGKRQLL